MPGRPRSSTSRSTPTDADALQRDQAVVRDRHLVTLALQRPRERFGDGGVVLGEQDRCHVRSLCRVVCAAGVDGAAGCRHDSVDDDLALALRLADAADAITLAPVPGRRPAGDDQAGPHAPSPTPTPPPRRRCARCSAPSGRATRCSARRAAASVPSAAGGWVLDPIDGTKNFSRGVPGLGDADRADGATARATVGVVERARAGPALVGRASGGRVDVGAPGGAPRRITVSGVADARRRLPVHDRPARRSASRGGLDRLARAGRRGAGRRARSATSGSTCLVAEGVIDVAVDPAANPWDLAALGPVVDGGGRAAHRPRRRRDPRGRQRAGHQRHAARRRPDRPAGRLTRPRLSPGPPGPAPRPRRRRTPAPRPPPSRSAASCAAYARQ